MGSLISWLDHSEDDQRRVREMLRLFTDRETVDDLGIGTVRDAISNALFPGTSTIQTRARYFLFIPWIFRWAEQTHPQRLLDKAHDMERSLIEVLRQGGDRDGLIGVEAGANVRTLPSAIFWGGLVQYRIFQERSLSARQYGRQAARGLAIVEQDELTDRSASFWQHSIPEPPTDFFRFRSADFDMSREEAEWLSERIISSDLAGERASLLTAYVRDLRRGHAPPAAESVWEENVPGDLGPSMRLLVHHAERFSCAAHGAALLYNLMLAEARSSEFDVTESTSIDIYRRELDEWRLRALPLQMPLWAAQLDQFWDCVLEFGGHIPQTTRVFVDDWSTIVATDPAVITSSQQARDLIRDREVRHKHAQARLINKKRLGEWSGYAGTAPLSFRWPQVRRMLGDIGDGLGGAETEDGSAVA